MEITAKLCGMLLVFLACVWTGRELELGLKRKWLFFRDLREALAFLEKEMAYRRTPVPESLREAACRCQKEAAALFTEAAELAEQRGRVSFRVIWQESVAKSGAFEMLEEQERLFVESLSDALSNTDTVMQRTLLAQYEERLLEAGREQERLYREKGALYRKLSAAAGIFLILLLL